MERKLELEILREEKTKGHIIRSRINYLNQPNGFINKTIKKIELWNGEIISDQKKVLNTVRDFYGDLFSKKDHRLTKSKNVLDELEIPAISDTHKDRLDGQLTLNELGITLNT